MSIIIKKNFLRLPPLETLWWPVHGCSPHTNRPMTHTKRAKILRQIIGYLGRRLFSDLDRMDRRRCAHLNRKAFRPRCMCKTNLFRPTTTQIDFPQKPMLPLIPFESHQKLGLRHGNKELAVIVARNLSDVCGGNFERCLWQQVWTFSITSLYHSRIASLSLS